MCRQSRNKDGEEANSGGGDGAWGRHVLSPNGRNDEKVVRGAEGRGKLPESTAGLS